MFSSIIAYNTLTPEQKTEVGFNAAFNNPSDAGGVVGMVSEDFRSVAWPEPASTSHSGSGSWSSSTSDASSGGSGGLLVVIGIIAFFAIAGHRPDDGSKTVATGLAATASSSRDTTVSKESARQVTAPAQVTPADVNKLAEIVRNPRTKLFVGENFSIRESADFNSVALSRSRSGGLVRDLGQTEAGWHKVSYFSAAGRSVANGFVTPAEWSKIALLSVPLGKSDRPVVAYVQQSDFLASLAIMKGDRAVAFLRTGETVAVLKRSKAAGTVVIQANTEQGPVTGEVPAAWLTNDNSTVAALNSASQDRPVQQPLTNRLSRSGAMSASSPVYYPIRAAYVSPQAGTLAYRGQRIGMPDFDQLADDEPTPRASTNVRQKPILR